MAFLSPEAWARWGDLARQLWDLLTLSIEPEPDAALWFLERVEIVAREEERAMTMARHILAGEMLAQLDGMLEALIEAGLTGKIVAEGRSLGRVETLRAADWLRWQRMPRELRRRAFDLRRDQLHYLEPGVPPIEDVSITVTPLLTCEQASETPEEPPPPGPEAQEKPPEPEEQPPAVATPSEAIEPAAPPAPSADPVKQPLPELPDTDIAKAIQTVWNRIGNPAGRLGIGVYAFHQEAEKELVRITRVAGAKISFSTTKRYLKWLREGRRLKKADEPK